MREVSGRVTITVCDDGECERLVRRAKSCAGCMAEPIEERPVTFSRSMAEKMVTLRTPDRARRRWNASTLGARDVGTA